MGLSTFTIMAGLGGSFGYIMGGINWGWLGKPVHSYFDFSAMETAGA